MVTLKLNKLRSNAKVKNNAITAFYTSETYVKECLKFIKYIEVELLKQFQPIGELYGKTIHRYIYMSGFMKTQY